MKSLKGLCPLIALLTTVFFISSHSFAQLIDGKKLAADMQEYEKAERKDPDANFQQAYFYVGYVTGVYDLSDDFYYYPAKPTIKDLCSVVAKYLKNNPEKWSMPADLLVVEALKQAFPK